MKYANNLFISFNYIGFKCKINYFYSFVDLNKMEVLLYDLEQLIEKRNEGNSQLRNQLNTDLVQNNGT